MVSELYHSKKVISIIFSNHIYNKFACISEHVHDLKKKKPKQTTTKNKHYITVIVVFSVMVELMRHS